MPQKPFPFEWWLEDRTFVQKSPILNECLLCLHLFASLCRARRRKKLSKALERQARKLRAKGITVDIETLKAEYLAQHRINSESDLDDDDIQIDVVGEDSDDDEPEDCSMTRRDSTDGRDSSGDSDAPKMSIRANPFSIESLLYNNTWDNAVHTERINEVLELLYLRNRSNWTADIHRVGAHEKQQISAIQKPRLHIYIQIHINRNSQAKMKCSSQEMRNVCIKKLLEFIKIDRYEFVFKGPIQGYPYIWFWPFHPFNSHWTPCFFEVESVLPFSRQLEKDQNIRATLKFQKVPKVSKFEKVQKSRHV